MTSVSIRITKGPCSRPFPPLHSLGILVLSGHSNEISLQDLILSAFPLGLCFKCPWDSPADEVPTSSMGQTCPKMWWGFTQWLLQLPSFDKEFGPVTCFLWSGFAEMGTVRKQFAHK